MNPGLRRLRIALYVSVAVSAVATLAMLVVVTLDGRLG